MVLKFLADIKVEAIFGNIKEVRQISSKFLSALQAAVDCPSVAVSFVISFFVGLKIFCYRKYGFIL